MKKARNQEILAKPSIKSVVYTNDCNIPSIQFGKVVIICCASEMRTIVTGGNKL